MLSKHHHQHHKTACAARSRTHKGARSQRRDCAECAELPRPHTSNCAVSPVSVSVSAHVCVSSVERRAHTRLLQQLLFVNHTARARARLVPRPSSYTRARARAPPTMCVHIMYRCSHSERARARWRPGERVYRLRVCVWCNMY